MKNAEPPDGRAGPKAKCTAQRVAFFCYAACAFLLLLSFARSVALDGHCGPLLPPAGKQLRGEAPFRFAVLGDNRSRTGVLEGILDRVKTQDVKVILHTGDIVKGADRREFQWLLHELAEEKLPVPFCVVPGNHDILDSEKESRADRYRLYEEAFGPRRYWFAYANTLFIAFDNAAGVAEPDDLRWLDATLEDFRGRYEACFVCMHMPIRDPRPGGGHAMTSGSAEPLLRILTKHRITAIFAGHIHTYLEDNVGGIPVFITGGAGATRDDPKLPYHYVLCTVKPDGSFTTERRDVTGDLGADATERTFRANFPLPTVLGVALALLALGLGITIVCAGNGRGQTPPAGGSGPRTPNQDEP